MNENLEVSHARVTNHRVVALLLGCFLFILLTFFYWKTLTGQATFFIADHCYYFEPFSKLIARSLAAHKLPLWNPYLYSGMSQTAVPSPGVFYPFTFFYAYMGYGQALSLILMLNQIICAVGCFLLVYSIGWGLTAATISGIALALCGYMFSAPNNYTLMAGAAPFPLMLWSYRRMRMDLDKNKRPYFAAATAMVATFMCVVAGRPELFVPSCLLTVLLIIYDAYVAFKAQRNFAPPLVWQFLTMASAMLLTMPTVLPVVEWVLQSPRSKGLNLGQTFMWSVNWYDLLSTFLIYPFGDLQILGARHLNIVATRPVFLPFIQSLYISPIVITCAIWGFADASWKQRKLLALFGLIVLILCLGEYTPLTPALFQAVPAMTVFRFPIKWFIFITFAIVLAAARGVYVLSNRDIGRSARVAGFSFWALSLVATLMFLGLAATKSHLIGTVPPLPVEAELWLGWAFAIGTAIGATTCIFEILLSKGKLPKKHAPVLLIGCVLLNLFIPAYKYKQQTVSPKFYSDDSFVANYINAEKQDIANKTSSTKGADGRFMSLYFDPFWTPPYYRWKDDPRWTVAFFDYARQMLLPNTNVDKQISETFGYEAAETGPYRKLFMDILHQSSVCLPGNRATDRQDTSTQHFSDQPLLCLSQCTATSWVGTQSWKGQKDVPDLDNRFFRLVKDDRHLNIRLYQVRHQLPRAYLSRYWRWCDSQQPIIEKIRDADKSEFNPAVMTLIERHAVTGESDIKGTDRDFGAIIPFAPTRDPEIPQSVEHSKLTDRDAIIDAFPVTLLTDEPEHVSLSVKVDRPCFLVLTDHFYPGWQASIDGAKRPCYRCNAEGRAVYIPAGAHLIEFNYFPDSLRIGLILAAIGACILALVIAAGFRPHVWRFIKFIAGQP